MDSRPFMPLCRALLVIATCAISVGVAAQPSRVPAATQPQTANLPPWKVPNPDTLADDSTGRAVRYGRDLIDHTSALIGPDAADPNKRFTGNGLECANCHLESGTQRFALPLVGIWHAYPAFSARINKQQTMAERINDCMQRSMNGRPLPEDGAEMAAILAYLQFLGSGEAASPPPIGRGAPALPLPTRAANPKHGAIVYQATCAACHQATGRGVRFSQLDQIEKKKRYLFPPLWGPESYNDAAGMSGNIIAAWFVHANMPRGITFAYPILAVNDAYDVAAYVNQQPRPHKADLPKDYPDLWLKPADSASPPFLGPFSAAQHKLGPWPPITDWLKAHAPHGRGSNRP